MNSQKLTKEGAAMKSNVAEKNLPGQVVYGTDAQGKSVISGSKVISMTSTRDRNFRIEEKKVSKLDELYYKRPVRQHVKEFGAIFGVIFLAIASWTIWKQGSPTLITTMLTLGFAFPILAYFATALVYPVWKGWMAFATGLGVVVTTIILSIMWTLVLVPISLILRIIGKKVIDSRFDTNIRTYWEDREERFHDFKLLERQF